MKLWIEELRAITIRFVELITGKKSNQPEALCGPIMKLNRMKSGFNFLYFSLR